MWSGEISGQSLHVMLLFCFNQDCTEVSRLSLADGETPFTSYGAPPVSAEADAVRLEAFGAELETV